MTGKEILEELKKLPPAERTTIIEAALRMTRESLQIVEKPLATTERKKQLTAAAEALLKDYTTDSELTIFTKIDSDDFHAQR